MATEKKTAQAAPPDASVRTAAAQATMSKVRALRDEIPDFTSPIFQGETKPLNNAASAPPAFVERTVVAMTNIPSLARTDALDPAVSRDLMAYAEAYAPLADELEALAAFVRRSVMSARHKAGTDALITYVFAQRLAEHPETGAELVPHVADMRRLLGRRRKAKQQAPSPGPVVPPAMTPPTEW